MKQQKMCAMCSGFAQHEKDSNGEYPHYKVTIDRQTVDNESTVKTFYLCPKCYRKLCKELKR